MQTENRWTTKSEWREHLLKKRRAISWERREEAAIASRNALLKKGTLLSFFPLGSEINLTLLNIELAKEGELFLPKVEGEELAFYRVTNLYEELDKSPHGILEPDATVCQRGVFGDLSAILVPALGFDAARYRIGYGLGFYDRLLEEAIRKLPCYGVGFKEQKVDELFPHDPWDVPLTDLFLF